MDFLGRSSVAAVCYDLVSRDSGFDSDDFARGQQKQEGISRPTGFDREPSEDGPASRRVCDLAGKTSGTCMNLVYAIGTLSEPVSLLGRSPTSGKLAAEGRAAFTG